MFRNTIKVSFELTSWPAFVPLSIPSVNQAHWHSVYIRHSQLWGYSVASPHVSAASNWVIHVLSVTVVVTKPVSTTCMWYWNYNISLDINKPMKYVWRVLDFGDLSHILWKYWIKWIVHIVLAILDVAKNTVK